MQMPLSLITVMMMAIVAYLLLIPANANQDGDLTRIIFLSDYFLLHTYIDPRPMKEALTNMTNSITRMKSINKNKKLDFELMVIHNYETVANEMLDELNLIMTSPERSERSIDFIGNLIHDIAGNPSASMHAELVNRVQQLETNQAASSINSKDIVDQIAIINKGLKDDNAIMERLSTIIQAHDSRLQKLERNEISYFNTLAFMGDAERLLFTAGESLRKIGTIATEGKFGFLSKHAIPPKVLERFIKRRSHTKLLTPLFWNEIDKYYNHKVAMTSWEKGMLHVTVKIPQVKKSELILLHPVTTNMRQVSKVDLSQFLAKAVNVETGGFTYLMESDLRKCMHINDPKALLCQRRPINIHHENVVVYEIAPTHILVNIHEDEPERDAVITCDGKQVRKKINDTSIVPLDTGCTMNHVYFHVGRIDFHTETKVPPKSIEISFLEKERKKAEERKNKKSIEELVKLIHLRGEDIKKHEGEIDSLKQANKELIQQSTTQSTIHYATTGSVGGVSVIAIIIIFILIYCIRSDVLSIRG